MITPGGMYSLDAGAREEALVANLRTQGAGAPGRLHCPAEHASGAGSLPSGRFARAEHLASGFCLEDSVQPTYSCLPHSPYI